ncbi:hypothetical protein E2C01_096721 [Portunus trituberculatus]|uniref:Uncharacterized protein n=1 Tax=Portunus trituberculatus TaxID=210409 RepID=A0A5B7JYM5_PORTR|nr:hypothetical protein [Portunus trituberculatus]
MYSSSSSPAAHDNQSTRQTASEPRRMRDGDKGSASRDVDLYLHGGMTTTLHHGESRSPTEAEP